MEQDEQEKKHSMNYEDLELYAFDEEMNSEDRKLARSLKPEGNGCLPALFVLVVVILIAMGGQS